MFIRLITNPETPEETPGYGTLIFKTPTVAEMREALATELEATVLQTLYYELDALRAHHTASYVAAQLPEGETIVGMNTVYQGMLTPSTLVADLPTPSSIINEETLTQSAYNLIAEADPGTGTTELTIPNSAACEANSYNIPFDSIMRSLRAAARTYTEVHALGSQRILLTLPRELTDTMRQGSLLDRMMASAPDEVKSLLENAVQTMATVVPFKNEIHLGAILDHLVKTDGNVATIDWTGHEEYLLHLLTAGFTQQEILSYLQETVFEMQAVNFYDQMRLFIPGLVHPGWSVQGEYLWETPVAGAAWKVLNPDVPGELAVAHTFSVAHKLMFKRPNDAGEVQWKLPDAEVFAKNVDVFGLHVAVEGAVRDLRQILEDSGPLQPVDPSEDELRTIVAVLEFPERYCVSPRRVVVDF